MNLDDDVRAAIDGTTPQQYAAWLTMFSQFGSCLGSNLVNISALQVTAHNVINLKLLFEVYNLTNPDARLWTQQEASQENQRHQRAGTEVTIETTCYAQE